MIYLYPTCKPIFAHPCKKGSQLTGYLQSTERPGDSPGVWVWPTVHTLPGFGDRVLLVRTQENDASEPGSSHTHILRERLAVQKAPWEGSKSPRATITCADTNSSVHRKPCADITSPSNLASNQVTEVSFSFLRLGGNRGPRSQNDSPLCWHSGRPCPLQGPSSGHLGLFGNCESCSKQLSQLR